MRQPGLSAIVFVLLVPGSGALAQASPCPAAVDVRLLGVTATTFDLAKALATRAVAAAKQ